VIVPAAAIGLVLLASTQAGEELAVSGSGTARVNRPTSVRDRTREIDVDRIYRRFLSGRLSVTDAARQILDRSELETSDQDVRGVMFPQAGPDSTSEQQQKTAELMQEMTRLIKLRGELQRHIDR
jgi:hypothetical protein